MDQDVRKKVRMDFQSLHGLAMNLKKDVHGTYYHLTGKMTCKRCYNDFLMVNS